MLQLVTIVERPDLAAIIAPWLWDEFWRDDSYSLQQVHERVAGSVARYGPPQCFVLLDNGAAIGTAGLAFQDLDERPDLSPWLAGVFVVPEARNRGHGTRLVATVEAACRSAGIDSLWLYTGTAERLYARIGWREVGIVERQDKPPVTLMQRDLGTPAC